jgi:hypothetical protein
MGEIFLSLKKLLNEIEQGELKDINVHLSSCWEELSLIEKDASIPPEVVNRNKKIIEELTVVLREYEGRPISEESLHQIRSKIFGESSKPKYVETVYPHLEEDVSDMIALLKEIERKMKKEENKHKK